MKKYIAILSLFTINAAAAQHGGSLVVEVTSVTCMSKSWDGVIEFDGPGNEIFVSGAFYKKNPSSNSNFRNQSGVLTTTTFGSTAGHNERTQGGTASPTGGVEKGNIIPFKGYTITTVELTPDGFVLLSPTLWERDDNNETIYERYKTQILSDLQMAAGMPFPTLPYNPANSFSNKVCNYGSGYNITIPPISYPSIFNPLVNPNATGNRPVGIVKTPGQETKFDPTIILIDAKNLWELYNRTPTTNHPYPNTAYPWKTVKELSIYCGENTYADNASNGSYYINLAIRFAPEGDDITAAWMAAQNPPKQPVINMPVIKNIPDKTMIPVKGAPFPVPAFTMNNEIMYGGWKGTLSMNDGTKTGLLNFKINNGTFWLQDNNTGSSIASGGFKIENNNFSATYSYPNGDSYTIVSTAYNTSTGEISGTLAGNGALANRRGIWKAVKVSN